MKQIPFSKMSGNGNDFIIVDNRDDIVDESNLHELIRRVCRRKLSVGADGFILVEDSEDVDFKWRFYNSDGSPAEMCGNGARCAARFARLNDIAGERMAFETGAGVVHARVEDDLVRIKMTDPGEMETGLPLELESGAIHVSRINTGVPHVVTSTEAIDEVDVVGLGREIRNHPVFSPNGVNANFIQSNPDGGFVIRTYERGVENETLACGTGAVAGALVMAKTMDAPSPVTMKTRGGSLDISFVFDEEEQTYTDVFLRGDARLIYKGELLRDAWS